MAISSQNMAQLATLFLFASTLLSDPVNGKTMARFVGFSQPGLNGFALRNHLLQTLYGVRNNARCVASCLRQTACVAVNYAEGDGTCELSNGRKGDFPSDVVQIAGWKYFEADPSGVENIDITQKMSTTPAPTTEVPTTEMLTTEMLTTEMLTTEMLTTEMLTTEMLTTEMLTTEMLTTEAPTTEAPTTEAPTTEAPTTEAPTTEAPTTEAPTTEAPTTEAPTAEAPTTKVPTTKVPTTVEVTTELLPRDCWDIQNSSPDSPDGEYSIFPSGDQKLTVYCDMTTDSGGWTVFQRRVDASQDFYLNWASYKAGFGDISGSFWLGNDALNVITTQQPYQLRIELHSFSSVETFAKYGYMKVENEVNKYRLTVSGFYGSFIAGDSMTFHSGSFFTTNDRDYDSDDTRQCAQVGHAGWWFANCAMSNINGPYQNSADVNSKGVGVTWGTWLTQFTSLKFTEMKIRPVSAQPDPRDCWNHLERGSTISGLYTIYVTGRTDPLNVYCDMLFDGGGWTTFQRRVHGDVSFYRNWADYKTGFGTIDNNDSDFWLGLEDIYLLTNQDDYQIRIVLSWSGNVRYARYSKFQISNEADNYRLTVGGYSGNAGDSLTTQHNGMPWSTMDRDNDNDARDCAEVMQGAWWYNMCQTSNLNGPYVGSPGSLEVNGRGIIWSSWLTQSTSIAEVEMKIRPSRVGY